MRAVEQYRSEGERRRRKDVKRGESDKNRARIRRGGVFACGRVTQEGNKKKGRLGIGIGVVWYRNSRIKGRNLN